ncbi:hypothetical protein AS888_03725 [Peribacillus simplex]|uniref:Uncharacterized protein n=1 Tax=Peribacillus simplex TaxID=1478 RepID=A0A120GQZ8_9BACI|nr:hypothetical protein [Peribacillus simplex]KWW22122.1 hypothetical protein AS888_03725 [Peribacillus simplex]
MPIAYLFYLGEELIMRKYYKTVLIIILGLIGTYFLFNSNVYLSSNKEPKTLITSDSENREVGNTVAYGMKNLEGDHIDNGSDLSSKNNKVSGVVSIDHNMDEDRKYALLIFDNYKQKTFIVENKEQVVNKHFFEMKSNSSINIKVSTSIDSNSRELTFLLVKKPEYNLREKDLNRAAVLGEVLSMRFSINDSDIMEENSEVRPDAIIRDGLYENLFVTNSKKKLQSIITEKEGKKLILSAGNDSNAEIRYAIIALKDWEQDTVIDNKIVLYTTVAPETRHLFHFNLPNVKTESNFQFIAFPFPYDVSDNNYESQQAFGSFRIVIKNDE